MHSFGLSKARLIASGSQTPIFLCSPLRKYLVEYGAQKAVRFEVKYEGIKSVVLAHSIRMWHITFIGLPKRQLYRFWLGVAPCTAG